MRERKHDTLGTSEDELSQRRKSIAFLLLLHIRHCKKGPQIRTALIMEHSWETIEALGFAPIVLDEPYRIIVQNNPVNFIDPKGLATTIIITSDYGLGSHAAVRVDNSGDPILYDPGGSYMNGARGSGDFFTGNEASLGSYIKYQQGTGSDINIISFNTTPQQESAIATNIENATNPGDFGCAKGVSNVLNGVGPFKDLGIYNLPDSLSNALQKLQKALYK